MATTETQTGLINTTVQAFDAGATSVSPQDGISMIDNWITALRSGDESTNPIASTLSELKMQLQAGNPNGGQIQALLTELAEQTDQAAGSADEATAPRLRDLAHALRSFGQALAGEGDPSATKRPQGIGPTGTSPNDTAGMQGGGSYGSGYGTGSEGQEGTPNSGTDMRSPGQ